MLCKFIISSVIIASNTPMGCISAPSYYVTVWSINELIPAHQIGCRFRDVRRLLEAPNIDTGKQGEDAPL
jgi:hypothetical protein